MHPSTRNPFLRGVQNLSYERVVQINYADDCPPCYRALHLAQNQLPNEAINLQPCLFDDDYAVITDSERVPPLVRMRCPVDGLVRTVLYQVIDSHLGRLLQLGDLPSEEAARDLVEQLSFATGHYSRSWEISSAHLPAEAFEYLQVRAWCNSPASFFECFELNSSHAVGCKLYSTPWVVGMGTGSSSCSIDEVSARLRDDHVPPALLQLLLLAGQADTRFLIFDPDAAALPELPLFTEN
ncbi:hypothetical protein N5D79_06335 [Pseudomonas sp. GD03817]|uniref:DUF5983 domain-containing protein n=1 Tax=Pseudomonas putida TaxID=303 RepID=A0A1L5PT24_PSEPU|nr:MULTISPECIES: hypothetical protein [Pseudomonas]APO83320.1 hypothetical protein BL240_18470 [Pseudomonas putida]MBA6136362.1 hypothetical protein [Pseudomonas monteilii]MCE0989643.1 hypothetical protein [Pseudomonas alloputida]MDH1400734.1 hypothetical protein [Pseudomonas sp. GD03730]MDH1774502.1 hypothetical protein [Pseudomonas sp. GD03817]